MSELESRGVGKIVIFTALVLLFGDGDSIGMVVVGDARIVCVTSIAVGICSDFTVSDLVGVSSVAVSGSSSGKSFACPLMCASISFLFLNVSSQMVHL